MEYDRRYRLVALVAAIGVLVGAFLFFHLATLAGRSQLAWTDLPEPVRQSVRKRAGEPVVVVEIVKARTPDVETYRITLHRADGSQDRVWLTAAGSPWVPADASKNR